MSSKIVQNVNKESAAHISRFVSDLKMEYGMTQWQVGHALGGVAGATVSRWASGQHEPERENYLALAALAKKCGYEAASQHFLLRAGQAVAHGLAVVDASTDSVRWIRRFFGNAALGTPSPVSDSYEMIAIDSSLLPRRGTIEAVKVKGDSMSPLVQSGWTVFVDVTQRDPKSLHKQMVAVRKPGEGGVGCTIKWLRYDGEHVMLVPQNLSKYEDVTIINNPEAEIIGKVVRWIGEPPP